MEDALGMPITSAYDSIVEISISKDVINHLITVNGNPLVIQNTVDDNDFTYTKVNCTIYAGESQGKFKFYPVADNIDRETEYFRLIVTKAQNEEYDVSRWFNGIYSGIYDKSEIELKLKTPEFLYEGNYNDNKITLEGYYNNELIDLSSYEINVEIELVFYDSIVDTNRSELYNLDVSDESDFDLSNFNNNKITVLNITNNELSLKLIKDNLNEGTEVVGIRLLNVNYDINFNSEFNSILVSNEVKIIKNISPVDIKLKLIQSTNVLNLDNINYLYENNENKFIIKTFDSNNNEIVLKEDLDLTFEILHQSNLGEYNGTLPITTDNGDFLKLEYDITISKDTSASELIVKLKDDLLIEDLEKCKIVLKEAKISSSKYFNSVILDDLQLYVFEDIKLYIDINRDKLTQYSFDEMNNLDLQKDFTNTREITIRDINGNIVKNIADYNIKFISDYTISTGFDTTIFYEAYTDSAILDLNMVMMAGETYVSLQPNDTELFEISPNRYATIIGTSFNYDIKIANVYQVTITSENNKNKSIQPDFDNPDKQFEYLVKLDKNVDVDTTFRIEVDNYSNLPKPTFDITILANTDESSFYFSLNNDYNIADSFILKIKKEVTNNLDNYIKNDYSITILEDNSEKVSIISPPKLYENIPLMQTFGFDDISNEPIKFNVTNTPTTDLLLNISVAYYNTTSSSDFRSPYNTSSFNVTIPSGSSFYSLDTSNFLIRDNSGVKEEFETFGIKINTITKVGGDSADSNNYSPATSAYNVIEIVSPPAWFTVNVSGFNTLEENHSVPYPYELKLKNPSGGNFYEGDPNYKIRFRVNLISIDIAPDDDEVTGAIIDHEAISDIFFNTAGDYILDTYENSDPELDDIIEFKTENSTNDKTIFSNYYQVRENENKSYFYLSTVGATNNSKPGDKFRSFKIVLDDFKIVPINKQVLNDNIESIYEDVSPFNSEYYGLIRDSSKTFSNDEELETLVSNLNSN